MSNELDQRILAIYKFLLEKGKITIDDVKEPYKSAIQSEENS